MNTEIINILKPYLKNTEAYLVGGYVRDFLLGKTSFDADIVIKHEDIKAFVKDIAQKITAHYVPLHESFGIYRLVLQELRVQLL